MATPGAAPRSIGNENCRGWALDNADATDRIKPRRPYTPYNLFYLLERERVVQGGVPPSVKDNALERASMVADRSEKRPEDDIPIPARYKNVVFLPKWYEPNLKEKRKHRKTHGKVSVAKYVYHACLSERLIFISDHALYVYLDLFQGFNWNYLQKLGND